MAANSKSFPKGRSGNPNGRPPGTRNRALLALDALLDGEAEAITRKAIEEAKAGNPIALRMCLDRVAPARKDRPITFDLPAIATTADLTKATGALLAGVAAGEITPSEAAEFGKVIDVHLRAIDAMDVSERLAKMESRMEEALRGAGSSKGLGR